MQTYLLLFFVLSNLIPTSDSICCFGRTPSSECCGQGDCNIFCCNCDFGCVDNIDECNGYGEYWKIRRTPLSTPLSTRDHALKRFREIDKDGNGYISTEEAITVLQRKQREADWFTSLDINNDGLLSPAEFDSSLQ